MPALSGVHVGTSPVEHLHNIRFTGASGSHQRCFAFGHRTVGIGARLQQPFDHAYARIIGRNQERANAETVDRLYVRARADKQIHRL